MTKVRGKPPIVADKATLELINDLEVSDKVVLDNGNVYWVTDGDYDSIEHGPCIGAKCIDLNIDRTERLFKKVDGNHILGVIGRIVRVIKADND
jgi:hypothetical protein